jgi:HSP20 family protein
MIKKIKPVTRVGKIEGDIRRIVNEVMSEQRELLGLQGSWLPPVDVYEKDAEIVVEAEAPGFSAKDLVISLQQSRVEIKGIKKENEVSHGIRYLRLEREFGRFRRVIQLPCSVSPEKAKAFLENGVLTIVLKKFRESREKDVTVKIQKGSD